MKMKRMTASMLISLCVLALMLAFGQMAVAGDVTQLKLVSHRYPALEFFAEVMSEPSDVEVIADLMPADKAREVATLELSTGSPTYDIIWVDAWDLAKYAAHGWLEPLDEFVEKYKDELHLEDYPPELLDAVSYNGHIYALPGDLNGMFLFYRQDLYEKAGLETPQTWDDLLAAAQKLTTKERFGMGMTLKRTSWAMNDYHYYLKSAGGDWLDDNYKPIFNQEPGVTAVEQMRKLMQYAPPGVLANGNDESTVLMQQDKTAMMLQWSSRAAAMDDASVSQVVGKVGFMPPPPKVAGQPHGALFTVTGYAISKFSRNDKEQIFRTIMYATSRESERRLAEYGVPSRTSIMSDPELAREHRHWPSLAATLNSGSSMMPRIPEIWEFGEDVALYLHRTLQGEMSAKEALDKAAAATEQLLKRRGYYKK